MATDSHNSHEVINREVGYDHTDLSIRGIIIFLAGVGIAGVVAHLVIWGMFVGAKKLAPYNTAPNPMASMETRTEAPPLQNAGPQSVVRFPEPRLQTDDTADMSKFKDQEDMDLWPSQPYRTSDGAIHININDAMAIIAQRGLPTQPAPQANAQTAEKAPASKKEKAPAAPKSAAPSAGK